MISNSANSLQNSQREREGVGRVSERQASRKNSRRRLYVGYLGDSDAERR